MSSVLVSFLLILRPQAASEAADLLKSSGVSAGLAVHLGSTDGALEAGLTHGGRILVHGLAHDEKSLAAARAALQSAGLCGMASIEKAAGFDPLPYADNLVNLLVADAALPGFSEREILRVLAPGGTALLRKAGAWTRIVKPRPREMDDWTHIDYGPEGNGVSRDRLVKPANFVQWISGIRPIKLGGNPAGFRVFTGMRVAEGRVFFEYGSAGERGPKREQAYAGRDAFNGLPLWTLPHSVSSAWREHQLVASKDRVYTFLEKGGPMVALDAASGAITLTYGQGGRLTDVAGQTAIRAAGETLVQAAGGSIYSLDAATGALRWKHSEEKAALLFPSVSPRGGHVFAAVADEGAAGQFSRWPYSRLQAIACLDLASGKPLWRNTEVAGADIGQLVPSGDTLALFGSGAIGGGKEPFIGAIRIPDGKLLWRSTFKTAYNRFGYNLLVRDGTMYYADAWRIYAVDMKTGEETRPFDDGGYNMRCNRFCATEDYLIYGYVAYVDRSWTGTYQSIARGGCSQGSVPANGMLYLTPNACG